METIFSCIICLEETSYYKTRIGRITSCNHGFCSTCLSNWSARRSYCPLCYSDIDGIREEFEGKVCFKEMKKMINEEEKREILNTTSVSFLLKKTELLMNFAQYLLRLIKKRDITDMVTTYQDDLKLIKQKLLLNRADDSTHLDLIYYDYFFYLSFQEKWNEAFELEDNFNEIENDYQWKVKEEFRKSEEINGIHIIGMQKKKKMRK